MVNFLYCVKSMNENTLNNNSYNQTDYSHIHFKLKKSWFASN